MTVRADDTVVVVVDVQNDYCHSEGALAIAGRAPADVSKVVDAIDELISAARGAGVPIIFLRMASSRWFTDRAWSRRGVGGEAAAEAAPIAALGSWGAELYRLEPKPDELVLDKYRHSGFPYTPLELVLRASGRGTVVVVGVSTNVCVEATARDAVTHGFEVVVVPECVAGTTPALNEASLELVDGFLGRTLPLTDLTHAWSGRDSAPA